MGSKSNHERLRVPIGELREVDVIDEGGVYFYMKVEIDLNKPLRIGTQIKMKDCPGKCVNMKYCVFLHFARIVDA